jgi:ABC-type transport system involved in multi-copper enzyme maturation permease subunit
MKTIIVREIFENIKSLRFLFLLIFSILLFSLNSMVFENKIKNEKKELNKCISFMKKHSIQTISGTVIYKEPCKFQFIAEGGEKNLPCIYSLSSNGTIEAASSTWYIPTRVDASRYNYKMPVSYEIDWVFIITIIFSLYVILLTFDAVSGEREQGTLMLTLSNPVKRIQFIISKYIAVFITLFIPFIIGIFSSLLILSFSVPDIISNEITTKIFIILVISTVYLSLFILMSLMLSSLIRQSSVVLLSLLAVWLLFLIIPEVSKVIAQKISNTPGEYSIAKVNYKLNEGFDPGSIMYKRIQNGEFKTVEEAKKAGEKLLLEHERQMSKIRADYENYLYGQIETTGNISRISPMTLFKYASESIAGTGIKSRKNFIEDIKKYSPIYQDYIKFKTGLTEIPELTYSQMVISFKSESFEIGRMPDDLKGDLSDFPIFQESKPSVSRILHDAMTDIIGLLLWNIVLAMGAFLAFNRADVR